MHISCNFRVFVCSFLNWSDNRVSCSRFKNKQKNNWVLRQRNLGNTVRTHSYEMDILDFRLWRGFLVSSSAKLEKHFLYDSFLFNFELIVLVPSLSVNSKEEWNG